MTSRPRAAGGDDSLLVSGLFSRNRRNPLRVEAVPFAMSPRKILGTMLAAAAALALDSSQLDAQVARRACEDAEAKGSVVVVAGPEEPGERLSIEGRVLDREGLPVATARVLAFHTDAEGFYSPGGMDESEARLCGVARTDAEGRFRFDTVRPGYYAEGARPPAHVHFRVVVAGREQSFTLQFADDERLGSRADGDGPTWSSVRPVERSSDGAMRVVRDLRLR